MSSKPRRKFDQNFKKNAVFLCAEPGRSVVKVAKNLRVGKDHRSEFTMTKDVPGIRNFHERFLPLAEKNTISKDPAK